MKRGQTSVRGGIQDILFPHENMNITQGNNGQYSHKGVNALDLAEKDGGRSPMYAPFDVVCKATDTKNGNAVWWQSQSKVRFADGTIDYATIMIIHDNDLTGIYVGAKYKQGTQIATEGTAGFATGNHNHFEIAKGAYSHMYDQNGFGTFHLPNSISADRACFIDGTNIINGNGMAWKHLGDMPVGNSTPKPSINTDTSVLNSIPSDFIREKATFTCTVDQINIRKAPSTKGTLTGDWYEKGMSFRYDGYVKREGYVWCSYIGSDGTRRWVACGELNSAGINVKPYGTFR